MVIQPHCVGTFFPADAAELRARVRGYLERVSPPAPAAAERCRPKAIIAPHGGYDYSGPIAASAYACLAGRARAIRRVVLVGTCHVVRARGLLATTAEAVATPLGRVPVDTESVEQAARLPQVSVDNDAHEADHALAVQLPFLQHVLGRDAPVVRGSPDPARDVARSGDRPQHVEFRVVPFLVAKCEAREVAEVLELLWGGDETLIVVSSDLSHYLSCDDARRRDAQTAAAIERSDGEAIGRDDACGHRAIAGLLLAAERHHLRARRIDLRNSGDTAGDRRLVVGYGAFIIEPAEHRQL
jgi:hypothetical protein